MPSVPYMIQKRRTRQAAGRSISRAGTGCALFTGLFAILLVFTVTYVYIQMTNGLPSAETLPALLQPVYGRLREPTRIYDRTGSHLLLTLKNPAAGESQYLQVAPGVSKDISIASMPADGSFPPSLIQATIASTDPTFWDNPGFAWDLRPGTATTLAERLVSDLLLPKEAPGLVHTLRIKLLAAQITSQYGKPKILEWYLNSLQYGQLLYGADAAARSYFHKPASKINLAEAAALASLSETPMENPAHNPQKVIDRQRSILQEMLKQGWAPSLQVKEAVQTPVYFYQANGSPESLAPAYTNLVLQQLEQYIDRRSLERGGYIIQTALDYDLQTQVQCAAGEQLKRIANGAGEVKDCQAARLLPTLPASNTGQATSPAAEIVVFDAQSGQVLALTARTATGENASLGIHEPGALITPIIDLTAFTRGLSPATLAWDIPASLPADLQNSASAEQFHGPVRLRTALANGYLAPSLQLLAQLSPETVAQTAQQLELNTINSASLARMLHQPPFLSGGEVNALQISQAYSVFATLGNLANSSVSVEQAENPSAHTDAGVILSLKSVDGTVLFDCGEQQMNCSQQRKPVASAQLAYLVTHILSDEAARWPSLGHPNSLEIGRPAGALIARSGNQGGWTVGFTPKIVVSVWMGGQAPNQGETNGSIDFISASAALWHAMMQYASQGNPPTGWNAPEGIVTLPVCDPSGMLPTAACPAVVNEIFVSGNEPLYPDSLYRSFSINRETGRLATVFTPPDLIEEKVFLMAPPEAETWARQAHLPQPPSDYDVIADPKPVSPGIQISLPAMFGSVRQKVVIKGSATVEDFQFYRLQVGQGLNPQQWIQIGKDTNSAVKAGVLGEWDTAGLSGLYAIQLQVVHKDQRIETITIQVTVDNLAPEIQIHAPVEGQIFPAASASAIVLESSANDNIGIAKVEYYVDRQLIASLSTAPYTLSWSGGSGNHRLTVRAYDLAGNQSEQSIQFQIQPK